MLRPSLLHFVSTAFTSLYGTHYTPINELSQVFRGVLGGGKRVVIWLYVLVLVVVFAVWLKNVQLQVLESVDVLLFHFGVFGMSKK